MFRGDRPFADHHLYPPPDKERAELESLRLVFSYLKNRHQNRSLWFQSGG